LGVGAVALYTLATGCFGGGTGGSNSNGPGSSSTDTASSSSGGPSGTDGGFVDNNPVIDDMSMQQSVTGGSWYTYDDRSVPNSEPPIIPTSPTSPPGFVSPSEGTSFFADIDGPMINDAGWMARMADGGGELTWGAGFGMDLNSGRPDGGDTILNHCGDAGVIFDTDPDAASVGIPQPFDASAYTGIGFYANSPGGSVSIEIHIDDVKTTPWGGMCNACISSGTCPTTGDAGLGGCPCSDNYIQKVLVSAGWHHYEIHWRGMAVQNWSGEKKYLPGDGGIDPSQIYNIHWQFTTSSGKALPGFSVQVAYVTWLGD
jgi:hypothetical protein